jgi:hypothetical protein
MPGKVARSGHTCRRIAIFFALEAPPALRIKALSPSRYFSLDPFAARFCFYFLLLPILEIRFFLLHHFHQVT